MFKNYLSILLAFTFAFTNVSFAQTKVDGALLKGDIIGGTASNTKRLVLPKDTKTNLDALNRLQGNLVFDTTGLKPYYDDGTSLKLIGSGSGGGGVNLITDGDADNATATILVPYQDSSGTRPTDGTGGTTTGITTARNTSSPIGGTADYTLIKDAANRQGGGWAIPFTVDPVYRAKSLKISVDYNVASGTFVAGANGASPVDGDIIWTVYDVTNSQIIEPSNIKMFSNTSTGTDKYEATFQTSATGASYRLIAHIASTSALAYTLRVDNITVSPQTYVYGTPITDYVSYTPTLSSSTNLTVNSMMFRREGDSIRLKGFFSWSGAGGGGTLTVSLPTGYVVDTTKVYPSVQNFMPGAGLWLDAGVARKGVSVIYNTTTTFAFEEITSSAGALTGPGFASGDTLSFEASFPIVGQGSSTQMSDTADNRIVLASYSRATTSYSANAILDFPTKITDTHNAVTTGASWRFTAPVAGFYSVYINWCVNSAGGLLLYKNGSLYQYLAGGITNGVFGGATTLELKAGDYIEPRADGTAGTTQVMSVLTIQRVSGPQAIAASESVNMRASSTSGQNFTTSTATTISYPTLDRATHGSAMWNGTQFKAPVAGLYQVQFVLQTNMVTSTSTNYMQLYKNGSTFVSEKEIPFDYKYDTTYDIEDEVYLKAGETLECKHFQATGSTRTANTSTGRNYVTITRVGN